MSLLDARNLSKTNRSNFDLYKSSCCDNRAVSQSCERDRAKKSLIMNSTRRFLMRGAAPRSSCRKCLTLLSDTKDFSRREIYLFYSFVSYKPFVFEFGQQGVGLASTEPTYFIEVVL